MQTEEQERVRLNLISRTGLKWFGPCGWCRYNAQVKTGVVAVVYRDGDDQWCVSVRSSRNPYPGDLHYGATIEQALHFAGLLQEKRDG